MWGDVRHERRQSRWWEGVGEHARCEGLGGPRREGSAPAGEVRRVALLGVRPRTGALGDDGLERRVARSGLQQQLAADSEPEPADTAGVERAGSTGTRARCVLTIATPTGMTRNTPQNTTTRPATLRRTQRRSDRPPGAGSSTHCDPGNDQDRARQCREEADDTRQVNPYEHRWAHRNHDPGDQRQDSARDRKPPTHDTRKPRIDRRDHRRSRDRNQTTDHVVGSRRARLGVHERAGENGHRATLLAAPASARPTLPRGTKAGAAPHRRAQRTRRRGGVGGCRGPARRPTQPGLLTSAQVLI